MSARLAQRHRDAPRLRRWGLVLAGLLVRSLFFFAIWLLLVDDPDQPDTLTGIATALGAAVFAEIVTTARSSSVRITPGMLRRLHRPLLLLVTDTARVTWALLLTLGGRPPQSRIRVAPYHATSEEDPSDYGRRLLTQWGASLGANRYVLGIDNARDQLIVHELVPSSSPLDPLELG